MNTCQSTTLFGLQLLPALPAKRRINVFLSRPKLAAISLRLAFAQHTLLTHVSNFPKTLVIADNADRMGASKVVQHKRRNNGRNAMDRNMRLYLQTEMVQSLTWANFNETETFSDRVALPAGPHTELGHDHLVILTRNDEVETSWRQPVGTSCSGRHADALVEPRRLDFLKVHRNPNVGREMELNRSASDNR